MPQGFIFMLTRHDRTVADALAHVPVALAAGVRHIGFKDIGLPFDELRQLNQLIQAGGATSYLEVVSLDEQQELRSVRAAIDIGVDVLLGGTRVEVVLPLIRAADIAYYPFPGKITGHPSELLGTVEEVVESAQCLARYPAVSGLDLLAYRSTGSAPALVEAVCMAVDKPVIVAGSIASVDQVRQVLAAGARSFTIGTAALDGCYAPGVAGLGAQLRAVMRDQAVLTQ